MLAWLACHLLADADLPAEWEIPAHIAAVGGQTARVVDDIGVLTADEGQLLFQSKEGLKLQKSAASPLGQAIGQVVGQYLHGIDDPALGRPARAVDPARDRLIIVTGESSPATVRVDLAAAVSGLARLPDGLPFTDVCGGEGTVRARDTVIEHVAREWTQRRGQAPSDRELRPLFRVLRVFAVSLGEGSTGRCEAIGLLGRVLADPDRSQAAWSALVEGALDLAGRQGWTDRRIVAGELERLGFPLDHRSGDGRPASAAAQLVGTWEDAAMPFAAGVFSLYGRLPGMHRYQAVVMRMVGEPRLKAKLLAAQSPDLAARVLASLDRPAAAAILDEMDTRLVSAILTRVPSDIRPSIIARMKSREDAR